MLWKLGLIRKDVIEMSQPVKSERNEKVSLAELESTPTQVRRHLSRKATLVITSVVLSLIVVVSVLFATNGGGSFLSQYFGGGGINMLSLQMDYDAWSGTFRSYHENDTVRIRDTITSVQVNNNYFGHPITSLYFSSHTVSLDDLESGNAKNESWYTWEPGSWSWSSPMFDLKLDNNTGKYLPECVGIYIQGDLSSTYHRGDTVEFELHVRAFGGAEYIKEWGTFGIVTPDKVHKVS